VFLRPATSLLLQGFGQEYYWVDAAHLGKDRDRCFPFGGQVKQGTATTVATGKPDATDAGMGYQLLPNLNPPAIQVRKYPIGHACFLRRPDYRGGDHLTGFRMQRVAFQQNRTTGSQGAGRIAPCCGKSKGKITGAKNGQGPYRDQHFS